jgi:hypothetical protein
MPTHVGWLLGGKKLCNMDARTDEKVPRVKLQRDFAMDATDSARRRRYFLTFFGLQRRFFFAATAPHSLQRKSPGFARRIGLPFKHPIRKFQGADKSTSHDAVGRPRITPASFELLVLAPERRMDRLRVERRIE